MMKEGGVSHQGSEYHPYANGNMQHMYNNSRQTPDSGLGNEELRNSMNNAGVGGDNSGAPTGSGAPPGFQPNPYYGMAPQAGNAQQSQFNDQQQQQFRQKQYSGSQPEGGRFEQRSGPPSIVTMQTSPPNMDQEGGPPYPNYGNYPQYGQGGPQYGGMDRNFNPSHQMAGRSHSNFSESSSSTLNMAGGGPPDASALSGQPLMAGGPHGPMMGYPQGGGGPMGPPYHPAMQQMQQGAFMFNPALAHQQGGGQMGQQQPGPQGMHHPHTLPMAAQQGGGPGGGPGMAPPGPPQSVSPPQPGMMMMPMGQQGVPMGHPGQQIYYNPAMMAQRGPMVGTGPEGFVQFTYPAPHPHGGAPQQQPGFAPMRGPMMQHQRSVNSPALSDNTDGQSVHGGGGGSIGMWTGPPDQQQSQQGSPPGSIHPMQGVTPQQMPPQPHMMQPGMMVMQPQMMSASYPGTAGPTPYGPGGPRMVPTTHAMMTHQQQLAMQHAMQQGGGMHMQHMAQMQHQFGPGGYPQQPQTQTGYWHGPPNQTGGRGGYGGGRGGGSREGSVRGGWRGGRSGSRQQYNSRNNSITSGGGRGGGTGGGGGRDSEEHSKGSTPTEDDITFSDLSAQMESALRMGVDQSMQSVDSAPVASPAHAHKQLLELAGEHPSSCCEGGDATNLSVPLDEHDQQEGGGSASLPTTPRNDQRKERKELLEMKKTPKQSDKSSPQHQSVPVDPLPHGETALTGGRKYSEVAGKMTCTYCKKQNRPEEEYTTHRVRDPVSMLCTCPILRTTGCEFCGEKGDMAHDKFFCSERVADQAAREAGVHHMPHPHAHPSHVPHVPHGGEGGYRGGAKRGRGGDGGGGGHYQNRGGRGGDRGGHGGDRKYESRRVQ